MDDGSHRHGGLSRQSQPRDGNITTPTTIFIACSRGSLKAGEATHVKIRGERNKNEQAIYVGITPVLMDGGFI